MTGNSPQVVYYAMGVVLLLSSLLAMRLPIGKALKMAFAWIGIFAAAFVLFAFRGEFQHFGQRLRAEALGSPEVDGQELCFPIDISERDEVNVLGMNFLSSLSSWRVEGNYLILQP